MPKYDISDYYNDLEGLKEDLLSFTLSYSDEYSRDVAKAFNTIINYTMDEQDRLAKEIRKNLKR